MFIVILEDRVESLSRTMYEVLVERESLKIVRAQKGTVLHGWYWKGKRPLYIDRIKERNIDGDVGRFIQWYEHFEIGWRLLK